MPKNEIVEYKDLKEIDDLNNLNVSLKRDTNTIFFYKCTDGKTMYRCSFDLTRGLSVKQLNYLKYLLKEVLLSR